MLTDNMSMIQVGMIIVVMVASFRGRLWDSVVLVVVEPIERMIGTSAFGPFK